MLRLHYDSKPTRVKQKIRCLPNVIYVDVLPNPLITAKDLYYLLHTYTSDVVFFIDENIFNNKVLLNEKVNLIQSHLCHTSARVYIINSPLLIYDLYHKMNPNDEVHFEEIRLFKVKAQHHFLIEVNSKGLSSTAITTKKDSVIQEKIHMICSRFLHVTLVKINEKHCDWQKALLSTLSVKRKT